jgi:hypothetical protein
MNHSLLPIAADAYRGQFRFIRSPRLAIASRVGGISIASAFAVLRLVTSWSFVGCSIGKSAGLAPFNILFPEDYHFATGRRVSNGKKSALHSGQAEVR